MVPPDNNHALYIRPRQIQNSAMVTEISDRIPLSKITSPFLLQIIILVFNKRNKLIKRLLNLFTISAYSGYDPEQNGTV